MLIIKSFPSNVHRGEHCLHLIGSAGYYAAYVVIIIQTISGAITIGTLTFLAGSFRQLRSLLEGYFITFYKLYHKALFTCVIFLTSSKYNQTLSHQKNHCHFQIQFKQGFVFENVGFKYHNSENWANRHLSFTLHAGEKLALVGENGAGKTTLVKLLARLYDPTEGRILLDGIDLREYDLFESAPQHRHHLPGLFALSNELCTKHCSW